MRIKEKVQHILLWCSTSKMGTLPGVFAPSGRRKVKQLIDWVYPAGLLQLIRLFSTYEPCFRVIGSL
jgi:hypothetical protein